ncbi:MAG: SCP2 sterol-binding domain-containing protein [Desulfatibacillum sp.]|nr:SCP2 sterol-binding domain-containing protein [Desulfatibacillum sp.]
MSTQTIVLSLDVKELVTEFLPKMALEYMGLRGMGQELAGTEFSMTVDISGSQYSFVVKEGKDFNAREGTLDNPMVHLTITLEDMQKLAQMKNIDMLLSMQEALSKTKYNVLASLKGAAVFDLAGNNGNNAVIRATFNGAYAPEAKFSLTMDDARLLTTKQTNPVNMFMNGTLKIEGDMAFAMQFQPLMA